MPHLRRLVVVLLLAATAAYLAQPQHAAPTFVFTSPVRLTVDDDITDPPTTAATAVSSSVPPPIMSSPSSSVPTVKMETAAYPGRWAGQLDEEGDQLEFLRSVPSTTLYYRTAHGKAAAAEATSSSSASSFSSQPRIACLYAGFMRNYQMMLAPCRGARCRVPRHAKAFGDTRRKILVGTQCDVFLSTWHLRGVGRFFTTSYDEGDLIQADDVIRSFGEDRVAALHVQNYTPYGEFWMYTHRFYRHFPQTRPLGYRSDAQLGLASLRWHGVPASNVLLRPNDFSQSYKHWCVLRLVADYLKRDPLARKDYDVYFRLRPDVRSDRFLQHFRFVDSFPRRTELSRRQLVVVNADTTSGLADATRRPLASREQQVGGAADLPQRSPFSASRRRLVAFISATLSQSDFETGNATAARQYATSLALWRAATASDATSGSGGSAPVKPGIVPAVTVHYAGRDVIHVNNHDVGDFGFMGSPTVIRALGQLWPLYCRKPPGTRDAAGKTLPVTRPPDIARIGSSPVSEYNLMLWRIIFDHQVRAVGNSSSSKDAEDNGDNQLLPDDDAAAAVLTHDAVPEGPPHYWLVDSGLRYLFVSRNRGASAAVGNQAKVAAPTVTSSSD